MNKGDKVQHKITDEIGVVSRLSELNNTIVWVVYEGSNNEYPQPIKNIFKL